MCFIKKFLYVLIPYLSYPALPTVLLKILVVVGTYCLLFLKRSDLFSAPFVRIDIIMLV